MTKTPLHQQKGGFDWYGPLKIKVGFMGPQCKMS